MSKSMQKQWQELEEDILSSKELTLHVLVALSGGQAKFLWQEYMDHIILGDDYDDAENDGTLAEVIENVRNCMDEYLNKIVEKEVLGAIPKN